MELPLMAFDPFLPNCSRCLEGDSAVNVTGYFSIGDEHLDMSMVNLKIDIAAGPTSPYKTRGADVWSLYCAIARTTCSKWFVDPYARIRFTFDCNCAPRVGDLYKIWIPIRPLEKFKGTVFRIRYSLQLDPAKDTVDPVVSSNFSVDSIFVSTAYKPHKPSISSDHKIFSVSESTKLVLMTGVCCALYLNLFISC
ncbi:unnamed protein product [Lymnaea stagnalis]|uniref:Uncharacterized protein n=1 Tax=Lymnaea stagnalis TaxID=6523 RepID=A0AAV2II69_LYMST